MITATAGRQGPLRPGLAVGPARRRSRIIRTWLPGRVCSAHLLALSRCIVGCRGLRLGAEPGPREDLEVSRRNVTTPGRPARPFGFGTPWLLRRPRRELRVDTAWDRGGCRSAGGLAVKLLDVGAASSCSRLAALQAAPTRASGPAALTGWRTPWTRPPPPSTSTTAPARWFRGRERRIVVLRRPRIELVKFRAYGDRSPRALQASAGGGGSRWTCFCGSFAQFFRFVTLFSSWSRPVRYTPQHGREPLQVRRGTSRPR